MRVVIIYESMYGNTHAIADAIAQGLEPGNRVSVVPVAGASEELLDGADLVVVEHGQVVGLVTGRGLGQAVQRAMRRAAPRRKRAGEPSGPAGEPSGHADECHGPAGGLIARDHAVL